MGRRGRLGRVLLGCALVGGFRPTDVRAQATAPGQARPIAVGDEVSVLARDGRPIGGRVLDVSDTSLILEQHGARLEVPYVDVVRAERDDPLWDGVANGLMAGAFFSWEASAVTACVEGWHCTVGLMSTYAGIGALIDHERRETLIGSKRDSPWDGGLKGLAIGLPVGMFNNQCNRARAWVCVGQVAAFYAGIGLILDYAHTPAGSSAAAATVVPIVSREAVGVSVLARWR